MDDRSSVRADEIARFGALAATWWNPAGPMGPLHDMNPLRVGWIDRRIRAEFGGPQRLLDLGCGVGLASEALARLGHTVVGIDAAAAVIDAARAHAAGQELPLKYRVGSVDRMTDIFPVVTCLEVIEHVDDPAVFLERIARVVPPGGLLFVSTLNRTARSLLVAKLGAEYIARLLPIGTHDWRRFVTPAELSRYGRNAGFHTAGAIGMTYNVTHRRWQSSADLGINYLAALRRLP